MDINTKKLKKNAFRVSKVRGLTASRVRVPGGCCNADVMQQVVDIARKYGNGQIHLTTRQGFEIEGIHMEDIDKVNEMLQPIIDNLQINQNETGTGYPASGTRNVCACIGNRVCPFGNYNTAAFAKRIEKAIFPTKKLCPRSSICTHASSGYIGLIPNFLVRMILTSSSSS